MGALIVRVATLNRDHAYTYLYNSPMVIQTIERRERCRHACIYLLDKHWKYRTLNLWIQFQTKYYKRVGGWRLNGFRAGLSVGQTWHTCLSHDINHRPKQNACQNLNRKPRLAVV